MFHLRGTQSITVDGKRIHKPDPDQAELVVELFQLAATGRYTMKSLAEKMQASGLRSSHGHGMFPSMVHKILLNPFYIGVNRWNGKEYPGRQVPIISVELFKDTQEAIRRPLKTLGRYDKHHALYQGLITYDACDGLVIWETRKGHWYGKCRASRICPRKPIREEQVEAQMISQLRALKSPNPQLVTWLRETLKEVFTAEDASRKAAESALADRAASVKSMLDMLYNDRLQGRLTGQQYDEKSIELHAQQAEIRRLSGKLQSEDLSFLDDGMTFVALTQTVADEYAKSKSVERKRSLISELTRSLRLHDKQLLCEFNARTQWVLSELVPLATQKMGPFGPGDNASSKQKRVPTGTPNHTWLGLAQSVRTIFSGDCQ